MIDVRSTREWLAGTLQALAARVRPQPVEQPVDRTAGQGGFQEVLRPLWGVPPPLGDQPATVCPCGHDRGRHYEGRGRCLACGEACWLYRGPWPVHHLHIETGPCPECGEKGLHWAVRMGQRLCLYSSLTELPGERP